MDRIFLLPGEYRISRGPEVIETLVGSCVSVCLYNTRSGRAAMNHFLRDRPGESSAEDVGHFGSTATEAIIRILFQQDPAAGHYAAQIFGGAAVVKTKTPGEAIGQKNIEGAREVLAAHRIRIIREEVGGTRGRRIRFDTSDNTVFCRFAGQVGKKSKK
jgi:chemotaxis protein CheD